MGNGNDGRGAQLGYGMNLGEKEIGNSYLGI